jgi:signal transduction histidine kinase
MSAPTAIQRRRAALVGAAVLGAGLAATGLVTGAAAASPEAILLVAAVAVSFTPLGAVVLASVPGHAVGRLMAAAGATAGAATLAVSWSTWLPAAWASQWVWWPPFGLIFLALLVFPDGRLPSPRWRTLAVAVAGGTALAAAALAIAALDEPRTLITAAAPPSTRRAQLLVLIAVGAMAATVLGLIGVAASLWVRWRRATGETRNQLACLLPAAVLLLLGLVLDALGLSGAWITIVAAVPLGMTIAVLRYRLYGLDQIVNRTIVWLVMTLLVVAGFTALVTLLRTAVLGGDTSTAALAATGLIAVTFDPLRRRVQRGVDRLVYGDRDDPYEVIRRLGDLLGRTAEPTAVLPLLTDAVARSLRVPYVAVELTGRDGPRLLGEHGGASTPAEPFPLLVRGEQVGRLLVAPRSPGGRFTRRESRLLGDVAVQVAVAADATRLIRDLQEARERLVMAREEERRRLRRDLHDGLGPVIAGMAMQVRAARGLLPGRTRADDILDALAADLRSCRREVRRLVDRLRPPALDRGLEAALRAECRRFQGAALDVRLRVGASLDDLPAAVEVAAYRIVSEALTNVARHARARTCRITVGRLRALTLEITDDGVGLTDPVRHGVGLASMRERAAELGGDCELTAASPRGTAVRVRLPLHRAERLLAARTTQAGG